MPGSASSCAAYVVPVGAAVERDRRRRPGPRHSATSARPRDAGIGSSAGSIAASAAASGNRWSAPPPVRASGSRTAAVSRPATRARAGHGDLLAEHRPDRHLVAVDVPGHAAARASRRTSGPRTGSPANASATATGSQSASSSRRVRSTAAAVSRRSVSVKRRRHERGRAGVRTSSSSTRTVPVPCGSASVRRVAAVARVLDAGHGPNGEEAEERARRRTACAPPVASSTVPVAVRGAARGARAARSAWRRTPRASSR